MRGGREKNYSKSNKRLHKLVTVIHIPFKKMYMDVNIIIWLIEKILMTFQNQRNGYNGL